jgi:hypothetical protein
MYGSLGMFKESLDEDLSIKYSNASRGPRDSLMGPKDFMGQGLKNRTYRVVISLLIVLFLDCQESDVLGQRIVILL